jgi:uncharacterized protein YbjT (DUF2867 family)
MKTYFVTGATGAVGTEVVRALLAEGYAVKAASRHPQKSIEEFGDVVEAVHFDFADESTFSTADDADGVFVLGPPMVLDLFNLLTPFIDYVTGKSQRIVYLSANGMDDLKELPFHAQAERKLKASDADWRIVRPGFFMQNLGNYERENIEQRKMVFVPAGEEKTAFISTRDIGNSVAKLLTEDAYRHQTFTLTGPEALNYIQVAELLSETLDEEIVYPNPDEATYRLVLSQAGAPDFIADYMIPVYGLIKNGKVSEVTNDVEKLTGQKPETLREVIARDFAK